MYAQTHTGKVRQWHAHTDKLGHAHTHTEAQKTHMHTQTHTNTKDRHAQTHTDTQAQKTQAHTHTRAGTHTNTECLHVHNNAMNQTVHNIKSKKSHITDVDVRLPPQKMYQINTTKKTMYKFEILSIYNLYIMEAIKKNTHLCQQ